MIWMPALPVRKNYNPGPRLANDGCNLETILPRVLNASVGNVEGAAPDYAENLRSIIRLALPVFGRAARSHLAARQIENSRPLPLFRSFEQGAAARLLHVVPVRSDGQNVEGFLRQGTHQSRFPCSSTTFSRTMRRCAAISFKVGRTRFTCSSVSTKMMITGSLPPASTR